MLLGICLSRIFPLLARRKNDLILDFLRILLRSLYHYNDPTERDNFSTKRGEMIRSKYRAILFYRDINRSIQSKFKNRYSSACYRRGDRAKNSGGLKRETLTGGDPFSPLALTPSRCKQQLLGPKRVGCARTAHESLFCYLLCPQ